MQRIDFEVLEDTILEGTEIAKWLLLEVASDTVYWATDTKTKKRREKEYHALAEATPIIDIPYQSLEEITEGYWLQELYWLGKYGDRFKEKVLLDGLTYRLLCLFFLNHISCPFSTKADDEDFCARNQLLLEEFLTALKKVTHKDCPHFHRRIDKLIESVEITTMLDSAVHIFEAKDKQIFRKAAIIMAAGAACAATGFWAAPAVGAIVGGAAGLKGSAAASYGLAKLGLGSIAAGGFGVVGGKFLVASTFGLAGAFASARTKEGDAQAQAILLPILLAIGRILKETGSQSISKDIHLLFKAREVELWKQNNSLQSLIAMLRDDPHLKFIDDSGNLYQASDLPVLEARLASIEFCIEMYKKAVEMSQRYDWYSFGFDFWEDPWLAA